jgi:hypothetical protein
MVKETRRRGEEEKGKVGMQEYSINKKVRKLIIQ